MTALYARSSADDRRLGANTRLQRQRHGDAAVRGVRGTCSYRHVDPERQDSTGVRRPISDQRLGNTRHIQSPGHKINVFHT